ncbi:diguanylate cyclase [Enterobacterales bacterium CwR94]|nr:diguanylate cyclase [Enterobacterales bacterium CwR94]
MLRLLKPRNDLRTLITLLAVASIVITLANSLYASWRVQRQVLIENTLESNRVYATKLASTTGLFFQQVQGQLAWSANYIADKLDDDAVLMAEVTRLREQTNSFNSVLIVDQYGRVKGISPESLKLRGVQLHTEAAKEALSERKPLISKPTLSAANNLMVFVSWPIWSKSGEYQGYIGGTIYLKKKSILNELLGAQFYRDGSSLMVTDGENRVLYHPDPRLLGQSVMPLIPDEQREQQQNGYREVMRDNTPMLAGYAVVPVANWTIIALKPTAATLQPLSGLLFKVLTHSVPFALLTLLCAWLMARWIALPLWQLARKASQMDTPAVASEINSIRSWYFEAAQIKRAMLTGISLVQEKIGRLKVEVQTDPMTRLLNRRGLSAVLEYFVATQQPFTVLALDIDHFKRVNDNWGHDTGDRVIASIASLLQDNARQGDVVCRNGGEEFLMILPGTTLTHASEVAERVREAVFMTPFPVVGQLSISIGVAEWQPMQQTLEQVFRQADNALYEAKHAGRNCVMTANTALADVAN